MRGRPLRHVRQELELPAAGYVDRFDGPEAIRRADALMADYGRVLERLRGKSAALAQAARPFFGQVSIRGL